MAPVGLARKELENRLLRCLVSRRFRRRDAPTARSCDAARCPSATKRMKHDNYKQSQPWLPDAIQLSQPVTRPQPAHIFLLGCFASLGRHRL